MSEIKCKKIDNINKLDFSELFQKNDKCLCVFDFDQALYKYNSGHQLLRTIIRRTRGKIIFALAVSLEKLLHKLKIPLNVEALIAKLFAPNISITSTAYIDSMQEIYQLIEDKSNNIIGSHQILNRLIEENLCSLILVLSNTPLDLSNTSLCNNPRIKCITRYNVALKNNINNLKDLYSFYIDKPMIINSFIGQGFKPCFILSDDPRELFKEFSVKILVRDDELYICN